MPPTADQMRLLIAMTHGARLKDHRDIEGHKTYVLYHPDGQHTPIAADDVEMLVELGLIGSNKKFPSATYWLTDAGREAVHREDA